jgi:hypothetical protein
VRLSGMAIGTQIGYAIGGFAPTAAAAIDGAGWWPVALYVLGSSLIAALAALTARETFRRRLDDIDGRSGRFSRDDAVLAQTVEEREERPLGIAEA